MSLLLILCAVFAALAVCGLVFGLPLYRALLAKTKVEAGKDDSIVTYPLA